MARKNIGLYNSGANNTQNHQLIIELGNDELVCMSVNTENGTADAFELFQLDKGYKDDWNDIFYEIKAASGIFNSNFKQVLCYFNSPESLMVPEKLLTATSAEDYLNLVFGESTRHEVKYEKLHSTKAFINAYRIRKSIVELLNRQFVIFKSSHIYSNIINDVFNRTRLDDNLIKIQFYSHHFIIAVWKDKKFQLIQSFTFNQTEDILYYLLRISHQFDFDNANTVLELSGMLDIESAIYGQINKLFTQIRLDCVHQASGVFLSALDEYPAHYLTPYYKLIQ